MYKVCFIKNLICKDHFVKTILHFLLRNNMNKMKSYKDSLTFLIFLEILIYVYNLILTTHIYVTYI